MLKGIDLEVSRGCNLKCIRCNRNYTSSFSAKDSSSYMQVSQLRKILQQLPNLEWIGFMGDGEPLIGPFEDLLGVIYSKGIKSILTTNGTLVSRDRVEYWGEHGLDRIHLSVDSLNQDILGDLRPGLDLRDIYKSAYTIRNQGIRLLVNFVMFGSNMEEIPNIGVFCKDYGAKLVLLIPSYLEDDFGRVFTYKEDIDRFNYYMDVLDNIGVTHNEVSVYPKVKRCVFTDWPFVTMEGDIYRCSYRAGIGPRQEYYFGESVEVDCNKFHLGNLFTRPFEEIWSEKMDPQDGKFKIGDALTIPQLKEYRRNGVSCEFCLFRWGQACY